MARFIALFLTALQLALVSGAASAQDHSTTRTIAPEPRVERWVEEWDPAAQRWVRVADAVPVSAPAASAISPSASSTARYAAPQVQSQLATGAREPGAQYGPFRVLDKTRAAMVGSTDQTSPAHFEAMLRDFPHLQVLEMIEAPGTMHDIANLAVGRQIRAAGLRTHVPDGGSVRSGAVELFLAGTQRTMDDGAEFAVHSWLDNFGREPDDFDPEHASNRLYLDYYVEMGMSEERAREFYAMTNSVPHSSALWLGAEDMRKWTKPALKIPAERRFSVERAQPAPIAVIEAAPLALPVAEVGIAVEAAQLFVDVPAKPSIEYGDLASLKLAASDAVRLDSPLSFP